MIKAKFSLSDQSNVRRSSGRPNQDRAAISVTISRANRDRLKQETNASSIVDKALKLYYSGNFINACNPCVTNTDF